MIGIDAFVADAVSCHGGKLFAHGAGWNVLGAARLPVRHAHLGLGIVFRLPASRLVRPQRFDVRLEDPDGELLAETGGTFGAVSVPHGADSAERAIPVGLGFDGLRFTRAGCHRFVISVDAKPLREVPLTVVELG